MSQFKIVCVIFLLSLFAWNLIQRAETPHFEGLASVRLEQSLISKDQSLEPMVTHHEDLKVDRSISPPRLDQVRKEIESNPHSTPQSILQFASNLGIKMELALKSEVKANRVFEELEDCALNRVQYSSLVLRAVCLSNAYVLGKHYSHLQLRKDSLFEKADVEAVRLAHVP